MIPGFGINFMIALAVRDLPEPDSPTNPTRSAGAIEKEMEWTTSSIPSLVGKLTETEATSTTAELLFSAASSFTFPL